jgi:hypothetical protein
MINRKLTISMSSSSSSNVNVNPVAVLHELLDESVEKCGECLITTEGTVRRQEAAPHIPLMLDNTK